MRVPHYAKRTFAALALSALAVGCGGGDSTSPDAPFNPAGTSSDVTGLQGSFESPAMAGYVSAAPAISLVLGEGSPAAVAVKAAPTKALVTGGKAGMRRYAANLAELHTRAGGMRPSMSTAAVAIPAEYLGVTFVYDASTDEYITSDRTGGPANGVRFIVYAVNPITGVPTEPLVEVGYADIVATETATSGSVRIELVSADVTYLDYTVGVTGTTSSFNISVTGFITNGTDRVNFDLSNTLNLSDTPGASSLVVDYVLTVPTRGGFRIDFEGNATESTSTVEIAARGEHGTVVISGSEANSAGTFQVRVNGELFATITTSASEPPVFTGADGQPLSEEELQALQDLYGVFVESFDFFQDLLDPIP
jgi:hypothetical protein